MNRFDPQSRLRELERRLGELERRLADQERRAVNDAQRFALLRLWTLVVLIVSMGAANVPNRRERNEHAAATRAAGPNDPRGNPGSGVVLNRDAGSGTRWERIERAPRGRMGHESN